MSEIQRRLVRLPRPPDPSVQRVTDAIAAVEAAEGALKKAKAALEAAKKERTDAIAAMAPHTPNRAEGWRLYWQTNMPMVEIARYLGLDGSQAKISSRIVDLVGPLTISLPCGHDISYRNRSEQQQKRFQHSGMCDTCQEAERLAAAERYRAEQEIRNQRRQQEKETRGQKPPGLSRMYLARDYFDEVCRRNHLGNLNGGWNNAPALAHQIASWHRDGTDLDFVRDMMDVFGEHPDWCAEARVPPWKVFIWKRNELAGMVKRRQRHQRRHQHQCPATTETRYARDANEPLVIVKCLLPLGHVGLHITILNHDNGDDWATSWEQDKDISHQPDLTEAFLSYVEATRSHGCQSEYDIGPATAPHCSHHVDDPDWSDGRLCPEAHVFRCDLYRGHGRDHAFMTEEWGLRWE